jgi:integrase
MREELTNDLARKVVPTPEKISRYFDTHKRAPRGFLLRVTPAGARAWALQYRVDGRQREITIGDPKSWPITEARKRGHDLRREIDAGGDPLGKRETARHAPTVEQLVERFIAEALKSRAPTTQAEYRAMLRDWILPDMGRIKVTAVTREHIEKLHQKITNAGKPRRANAVKSLVSTLFAQAIVWRMRDDNPTTHVKGNREHGRRRFLKPEEHARLMEKLEDYRPRKRDSVDKIELAAFIGARRGEILAMEWKDLDLDRGVWSKPPAITKQRQAHTVPLNDGALAVLRRRYAERANGSVPLHTVFRHGNSKAGANALEKDWYIIRAAAGLEDVRFHDLRHSFASLLASEGISLPIIGALLGHSKPQTTSRYAHLADQPLREAADIVAKKLVRR